MMSSLSTLAAPAIFKTSGATSDDNDGIMATLGIQYKLSAGVTNLF